MSKLGKNIIAIIVAGVAIAGILAVIILACITIKPISKVGWEDFQSVELYYGGKPLSVNIEKELDGDGNNPNHYGIKDIFDKMDFTLFSTCIQFNYEYGLSYRDNSKIKNNEITAKELSDVIDAAKTSKENEYIFIIRKKEVATTTLTDAYGRSNEIEYNTVMFSLNTNIASDWPKAVKAYLFVWENLVKENTEVGENVDSYKYYELKFSAKTSGVINALDEIYNIDSTKKIEEEKPEESEEQEAGEDANNKTEA